MQTVGVHVKLWSDTFAFLGDGHVGKRMCSEVSNAALGQLCLHSSKLLSLQKTAELGSFIFCVFYC